MEERKKVVIAEKRRAVVRAEAPVVRSSIVPERKVSPCAYQTQEEIEKYYRAAEVGAVAVVRQTQYHMLVYYVTDVEAILGRGRAYIRNHGSFYMKSGKNCFHPKGQTTLVVPTPEVLQWAVEHPRGELDWWTFPPERVGILSGS